MAKIVEVEIFIIDLKPKTTRFDAIQSFISQQTPFVIITDSDGFKGIGYSYTIGTGGSSIVKLLEDTLCKNLIGKEANNIQNIWKELKFCTNATTVGAITSLSLAPIDIALWDLKAKRAKLPIHTLLGGAKKRLPVYSTEGGWIQLGSHELTEYATLMKQKGFKGNKVKIGLGVSEDYKRLKSIRDSVGFDFDIMVDANQSLGFEGALRFINRAKELDIAWLEEPFSADDIDSHIKISNLSYIPIAVGESIYSISSFKDYIQMGGCSIIQVDVARVGGITPWIKVAHMCEAFNIPISPHFLMELHVNIACGVEASKFIEYIPQLDTITKSKAKIEDGFIYPSQDLGIGIDFDFDKIESMKLYSTKIDAKSV